MIKLPDPWQLLGESMLSSSRSWDPSFFSPQVLKPRIRACYWRSCSRRMGFQTQLCLALCGTRCQRLFPSAKKWRGDATIQKTGLQRPPWEDHLPMRRPQSRAWSRAAWLQVFVLGRVSPEAGGGRSMDGDSSPQKQAGATLNVPIQVDQFSLALVMGSTAIGPPASTKASSSTSRS